MSKEVMKMLTEERFDVIRELLTGDSIVKIQAIVEATQASESTVRRDLSQLEELGELVRVHGGAKRQFSLESEPSVPEKNLRFHDEKQSIGQYAAQLIQDNEFIYLDAGTTTLAMVPHIKAKGLTIVTNSLDLAGHLSEAALKVVVLGGSLKNRTRAMIGSDAQKQLKQYRFSRAFMGTNGIDTKFGFTTPDSEEAHVKQTAAQQANRVYVLADASKFDKVSFCQFMELDEAIVITSPLGDRLGDKYHGVLEIKEVDR
ncbi:DeoR family transcriptional regulator [Aerococcaceae bacterium WS4759]|uniref:DeoR family transcriptional regulator n=2 Tax=Fundicoccus ignavus TaxID=2664442 RepID=A0A6I2GNM2_9LACT|nr:DeoR family transcriptional regulator [Fundicoccus ignavus]